MSRQLRTPVLLSLPLPNTTFSAYEAAGKVGFLIDVAGDYANLVYEGIQIFGRWGLRKQAVESLLRPGANGMCAVTMDTARLTSRHGS